MALFDSFPDQFRALVIGATGGIGAEVLRALQSDPRCGRVTALSRSSDPRLDLEHEESIERCAAQLVQDGPLHLIFDATGLLHDGDLVPERALRAVEPENALRAFAVNALGPLLLLKHLHALMPRHERSVFATISARVGSIEDNRLGGWYSYRGSKAALNMFLKSASIEVARKRPQAVCLALHPGTVETRLSDPFASNHTRMSASESANRLLTVINGAGPEANGHFLAYDGEEIAW